MSRRRPRPSHPALLPLEPRQLLSASVSEGLLTITGTSGDDRVTIYRDSAHPNKIYVAEQRNGRRRIVLSAFRYFGVEQIRANLGNGDDRLVVDEFDGLIERHREIYGDAGDDTINGGTLDDVINGGLGDDSVTGGAGRDVIVGAEGNDTVRGGNGNDSIYGQDGIDSLFGDAGANLIISGNGRDFVNGVQEPPPPPPATPLNFSATAVSATQIRLDWDDDTDETGFVIERSPDGTTNWTQVAAPAMDAVTYNDTGLTSSTTYYYRLRATNEGGDSATTAVVNATTNAVVPAVPTNVVVVDNSPTTLQVYWDDVAGETAYRVERSPNGVNNWTFAAALGANVTTSIRGGLAPNTQYFFRVRASNSAGNSAFSTVASGTTDDPAVPVPAAVANFAAAAQSATSVQLSWDDLPDETEYRIERSIGAGAFSPLATLGPDTIGFTDSGLTTGTVYNYQIVPHNFGGNGPASTATATTP